ncbi:MAG: nucleotidyltransferase domain-containing protein [Gammaproteobacteria bacterium]|nr:nucleotidyltransferase domain-containing protein [Gammaproteobacteria bacterium]
MNEAFNVDLTESSEKAEKRTQLNVSMWNWFLTQFCTVGISNATLKSILNSMKNKSVQHKLIVLHRDDVRAKLLAMKPELEARGITSVGLFGSVARDEATEQSDIDLAVTVKPGTGLFSFSDARLFAEDELSVSVDLAILSDFIPARLQSAKEDLIPIF